MADSGATARILGVVHSAIAHDSAAKHVAGDALYIDDLPEPADLLHIHVGQSARAHAKITRLDLSKVKSALGVVCVLSACDVPGKNDISPIANDDPRLERLLGRYSEGIFVAPFEIGEIGPDLFKAACAMGLEGLVSKDSGRAYTAGRCSHWIKVKNPAHPAMTRVEKSFRGKNDRAA